MNKGKFGINLSFYAVLAFILVIFDQDFLLFLLAGATIFVEKDEWASRQVIEAIMLCFVNSVISAFFGLFSFMYKIPFIGTAWGTIISVVEGLCSIVILVFAIIALVNTAKGKEANVPLASKFANWAYGKVVVKPQPVYYQQPVQGQPMQGQPMQGQPVYQQPMQQPMQQPVQQPMQQPVQQPMQQPVQPAQPADVCAKCGAPLNGGAFCTKCGTPAAK